MDERRDDCRYGGLGADGLAARLRAGVPAVVARVHDGGLLLDPRTLDDADAEAVVAAIVAALSHE